MIEIDARNHFGSYEIMLDSHKKINLLKDINGWYRYLETGQLKEVSLQICIDETQKDHWDIKQRYKYGFNLDFPKERRCWEQQSFYSKEKENWEDLYVPIDSIKWEGYLSGEYHYEALIKTLKENLEFAQTWPGDSFYSHFVEAYQILCREKVEQDKYLLSPIYQDDAKVFMRALFIIGNLFGGMGNWDDGGVPTELTDELYKQFIQGVLYCVNAGDEPGFSLEG